ncbi:potassium/proton antiporter, partial [Pseudomonas sp. BGM005]|nr:potassium/proton antiporter [Pseudomonas sp. BG5]
TSVGMSLEAVEPAITLPIFINLKDIIQRIRDRLKGRRSREAATSEGAAKASAGGEEARRENGR